MERSTQNISGVFGRVTVVLMVLAAMLVLTTSIGCNEAGLGGYYPVPTMFDATGMIQDSYDYQQSVFDTANDNFTDYLRM